MVRKFVGFVLIKLMEENKEETGIIRDEQGKFVPGVSGNPEGRPPETPEQKIIKKATQELVKNYKDTLAEALPQVSPVLIAKAIAGDIQAIKELHDRVMGRPEQKTEFDVPRDTLAELTEFFRIVAKPKANDQGGPSSV